MSKRPPRKVAVPHRADQAVRFGLTRTLTVLRIEEGIDLLEDAGLIERVRLPGGDVLLRAPYAAEPARHGYRLTDGELEMLHGMPWIAQLIYFQGILPHIGASIVIDGWCCRLSPCVIAECLTVPAAQGRHSDAQEMTAVKGVRA